jgi:hypothetical protein
MALLGRIPYTTREKSLPRYGARIALPHGYAASVSREAYLLDVPDSAARRWPYPSINRTAGSQYAGGP